MKNKSIICLVVLLAVGSSAVAVLGQETKNDKIASEIIAITKTSWKAQMEKKSVELIFQNLTEDCTLYGFNSPTRVDGKDAILQIARGFNSGDGQMVSMNMLNEKVQVYDNVAILTYNFVAYSKDKTGELTPITTKATRVFIKEGGKWMQVHSHFSQV